MTTTTAPEAASGLKARLRYMTAEEIGEIVCVDARTIHRWAEEGVMPRGLKAGMTRRWLETEIEAWLTAGSGQSEAPDHQADPAN